MYTKDSSSWYQDYAIDRAIISLLEYATEDFQFDISVSIGGLFSGEGVIKGKGFGEFMAQFMRVATYMER